MKTSPEPMPATLAETGSPPCVFCRHPKSVVLDELSGREIRELWRLGGHVLSEHALRPMESDSQVRLHECRKCGLRYYDPRWAGGAEFYEELMPSAAYASSRPEFLFALQFACQRKLRRVLDVGGGEGAFLDLAREHGLETFGVELNRDAAAVAAQKGHRMFTRSLNEIPLEELGGGMDLLTLFQVVEHVPAPCEFVKDASRLVKPGGFLIIAVPNEHRAFGLHPYDPANWPPHHVSRWRRRNLAQLAQETGLRLLTIQGEPLEATTLQLYWRAHLRQTCAIRRRPLPGESCLRLVTALYRGLGCKYYFPRMGLSLYAVLQKR